MIEFIVAVVWCLGLALFLGWMADDHDRRRVP